MAKIQGVLPVYHPATKRILGAFNLALSKTFTGDETTTNIDAPNAADATNTVPVMKVVPNYQTINPERKAVDWYMAVPVSDADARSGAYKNWKNFATIEDMAPSSEWTGAASGPQFRVNWGNLINGLESGFITGAPVAKPANTVAPTITGTMTAAQVLSINQGTWTENAGRTVTYQWKLDGVAGVTTATYTVPAASVGKIVTCDVTHTYGGESTTVTTVGRAITA
jgi:hypothetical protein